MTAITMPAVAPAAPQPPADEPRADGCWCWPVCWCGSKGEAR